VSEPAAAGEPAQKSRFALPSAYTILFALIVVAALATWIIPAGVYNLNAAGEPIPGTYHEVAGHPARILVDSLTAPINGLYGIEDAKGNINYYNSGSLFGAIDIALFILVIGGFLGITMKTGAIQAGIGSLVKRMAGRERLNNRDVFHITFRPKKKDDFGWSGDAYIDTTAYQPVLVTTAMARKIPFAVRTLLGTNVPGLGFTVTYAPQADGVWFPVTFSTEFKIHVLYFFHRQIFLNAENREFEKTHVTSRIVGEATAVEPGSSQPQ